MGYYGIPGRRYFRKRTPKGVRTHHLHVFAAGAPALTRHLAFRDYLIAHPDVAAAYGALKRRLAASPGVTWDGYVDGKAPFVAEVERAALVWVGARAAPKP